MSPVAEINQRPEGEGVTNRVLGSQPSWVQSRAHSESRAGAWGRKLKIFTLRLLSCCSTPMALHIVPRTRQDFPPHRTFALASARSAPSQTQLLLILVSVPSLDRSSLIGVLTQLSPVTPFCFFLSIYYNL